MDRTGKRRPKSGWAGSVTSMSSGGTEVGFSEGALTHRVDGPLVLVPDLQEAVLFLPRTVRGRDPIPLWRLQPIAAALDWRKQRRLWAGLRGR